MRCRFCGSKSLHEDAQHKTFSTGKAVAGAVVFGVVGAAAGFIGKDQKGYRCGACGQFMDSPMDFFTESQVDSAIREAESGHSRALFDYYHGQYANITANIPQALPAASSAPVQEIVYKPMIASAPAGTTLKRSYRYGLWQPDCPVWVEAVILKSAEGVDKLSLAAWNLSDKTVRSVYYLVKVYDDTGDQVSDCRCVYQGLAIAHGEKLPEQKEFPLNTELAYRVELICEKVAFEGDEVWRGEGAVETISLPEQPELTADNFPRLKYANPFFSLLEDEAEDENFRMPMQGDGFWLCCCGTPVRDGQKCPRCGDIWKHVEGCFSQQYLMERQQKAVHERAAKRAAALGSRLESVKRERAKQAKAQETARKNAIYKKAVALQEENRPESLREAAKEFESIPGWRDADERAKTCLAQADEIEEKEQIEEEERREREAKEEAERKRKTKKIATIATPIAVVCVAFVIVLVTIILPKQRYNAAVERYGQAAVDRYGVKFLLAGVGDKITFGSYEQDNDLSNGSEDIEWIVLAREKDRILVISKYALFFRGYNNDTAAITWSNCTLRTFLNGTFLDDAFTPDEQAMIPTVTVSAGGNPDYSTRPGKDTQDKVFLLSIEEANEYFSFNFTRRCKCTAYAKESADFTVSHDYISWWLRSPGSEQKYAAEVSEDGSLKTYGMLVSVHHAVRPALWIDLG